MVRCVGNPLVGGPCGAVGATDPDDDSIVHWGVVRAGPRHTSTATCRTRVLLWPPPLKATQLSSDLSASRLDTSRLDALESAGGEAARPAWCVALGGGGRASHQDRRGVVRAQGRGGRRRAPLSSVAPGTHNDAPTRGRVSHPGGGRGTDMHTEQSQ